MISGGSISWSDDLWISGGTMYIHGDDPGFLCGMVKIGDGRREFAYAVITRHRLASPPSLARSTQVQSDGFLGWIKDTFEIEKGKIDLAYRIELNAESRQPESESLAINGREVRLDAGRLFLVDLAGDPGAWQQIETGFGDEPPAPVSTETVREMAGKYIKDLKKRVPAVRDFLE
jgi:hypothetical protein